MLPRARPQKSRFALSDFKLPAITTLGKPTIDKVEENPLLLLKYQVQLTTLAAAGNAPNGYQLVSNLTS